MAGYDTMMKALTRALSNGALEVFDIFDVELAESLPNDLPANTLRLDKAWRMMDGRLFHLEFQSARETTLHRFLEYDARLAREYGRKIRTVVLYHGETVTAPSELNIGTAVYRVENVFLSTLNGDDALTAVETHLQAGQWAPQDRLRLALALNMHVDQMAIALERVLTLVNVIPDRSERDLVVSAILALGDHALTDTQRAWIRKELRRMSKLAEELYREGREEGREEGERDRAMAIARKLLGAGESVAKVAELTELTLEEVQKLQPVRR